MLIFAFEILQLVQCWRLIEAQAHFVKFIKEKVIVLRRPTYGIHYVAEPSEHPE